jgi:hypothetical protein
MEGTQMFSTQEDDRSTAADMFSLNVTTSLAAAPTIGEVDLDAAESGDAAEDTWQRLLLKNPIPESINISDGQALLITQEEHGHLFSKQFKLDNLKFDDKVVLQLSATGHGWESTAEQCGEYCHAVYRIKLNGNEVANVTQFRDDCHLNPISKQYGTWDESRNGWCPGTVNPGIFFDVTNHVQEGNNSMEFAILVWSNATLKYEPYMDNAGFIFDDHAHLAVGISAFVYGADAVQAIKGQHRAFTAAEAAIRNGSSAPERMTPPAVVREQNLDQVFLEMGQRPKSYAKKARQAMPRQHTSAPEPSRSSIESSSDSHEVGVSASGTQIHAHRHTFMRSEFGEKSISLHEQGSQPVHHQHHPGHHLHHLQHHHRQHLHTKHEGRFDFEHRAPWYLWNETREGPVDNMNIHRVELFANKLSQASSRQLSVSVDSDAIPEDWDHVALLLHLHKPFGDLDYDHWDRVGSVGLLFEHKDPSINDDDGGSIL